MDSNRRKKKERVGGRKAPRKLYQDLLGKKVAIPGFAVPQGGYEPDDICWGRVRVMPMPVPGICKNPCCVPPLNPRCSLLGAVRDLVLQCMFGLVVSRSSRRMFAEFVCAPWLTSIRGMLDEAEEYPCCMHRLLVSNRI